MRSRRRETAQVPVRADRVPSAKQVEDLLSALRGLAKSQTAAIYKRQGSGENVFGVLTSEIAKLARRIKVDHGLSRQLWQTGNAEARILSLLVADPNQLTRADADALLADGPVRFLGCYLSDLIARAPVADATMRTWASSSDEHAREMGYGILGVRLREDPGAIDDADALEFLAIIEKEIHASPNWARYAMNGALIAIGVYKPALRAASIATARRIGKVTVDAGAVSCRTPDAVSSIEEASKRKRCP